MVRVRFIAGDKQRDVLCRRAEISSLKIRKPGT